MCALLLFFKVAGMNYEPIYICYLAYYIIEFLFFYFIMEFEIDFSFVMVTSGLLFICVILHVFSKTFIFP